MTIKIEGGLPNENGRCKRLEKPVSELVLGITWGKSRKAGCFEEILNTYIAQWGNTIDAGCFYGVSGESEVCLREWINNGGARENVYIINKFCHPFVRRNGYFDDNSRWRVSAELITEDLEFSLNRVRIDYFDVYLVHHDDVNVPVGETLGEHRNLPKCSAENEIWYIPSVRGQEEQLRRFLNCYRMNSDLDRDTGNTQPRNCAGYAKVVVAVS